MSPRPRYFLELEAAPGQPPPERRLARLLKTMLRAYGLRCVSVAERRAKADQRPLFAKPVLFLTGASHKDGPQVQNPANKTRKIKVI